MIHRFDTIDSTMTEAARLAQAGCPSGTAVVADEQTSGQGRHGHTWHSEKGTGLYVSVVLRLEIAPEAFPALTMALALAAADAVARTSGLSCDLRWPNDVLVQGKKCGGVLVQVRDDAMVAGIGINVNQASFPPELSEIATSLRIASGRTQSKDDLLSALLDAVDRFCTMLVDGGRNAILEAFSRRSSFVRGKRVVVDRGDSFVRGVTEGLDPSGFLILRTDEGNQMLIITGGVREENATSCC